MDETEQNFQIFGDAFPNAVVAASTLDRFFHALGPVKDQLPVVTSELGDTWVYGLASDPLKLAEMRVMMRHRSACVAADGCASREPGLQAFTHALLKLGEHTWGGSYAGHMNCTQVSMRYMGGGYEVYGG